MYPFAFTLVPALASSEAAKRCMNVTVQADLSVRIGVLGNVEVPQTSLEATSFIQDLSQEGQNYSGTVLNGCQTTSKTYNISMRFCVQLSGLVIQ